MLAARREKGEPIAIREPGRCLINPRASDEEIDKCQGARRDGRGQDWVSVD